MGQAGGGAENDWQAELFGEIKGQDGQVLEFLGVGRLDHGQAGELGVVAVVLLVLAGEEGGIVGVVDDQAGVDPDVGQGHERVGGDVEADVFEGGHGPDAGHGRPGHRLHGHLLVGRVLEVETGLVPDLKEGVGHLGRGRARIRAGKGQPRLQGPADDGLVAQQQQFFTLPARDNLAHTRLL